MKYRLGTIFTNYANHLAMLVQADSDRKCCLIDLDRGNRWHEPVKLYWDSFELAVDIPDDSLIWGGIKWMPLNIHIPTLIRESPRDFYNYNYTDIKKPRRIIRCRKIERSEK